MKGLALLIALIGMIANAFGQDITEPPIPKSIRWHVRSQFAGFQGLVSIGGGPVLAKGVWRPALMYGYAPPARGREAVHQIILHNDIVFRPAQREKDLWISPAISFNLLMETGRHSYLRLPDRFPEGYYAAPIPHMTLGFGARLNRQLRGIKLIREVSFGAEFVGLDTFMWYAISQRSISLHKAFGLSFALAAAF